MFPSSQGQHKPKCFLTTLARWNKATQVWKDIRMTKWFHFPFWVNYCFNYSRAHLRNYRSGASGTVFIINTYCKENSPKIPLQKRNLHAQVPLVPSKRFPRRGANGSRSPRLSILFFKLVRVRSSLLNSFYLRRTTGPRSAWSSYRDNSVESSLKVRPALEGRDEKWDAQVGTKEIAVCNRVCLISSHNTNYCITLIMPTEGPSNQIQHAYCVNREFLF